MPTTQNLMASTELLQFQRVLPCVIIDKYQDWKFRQQVQYEAIAGLIAEDFLSIEDFIACMDATQNGADKLAWNLYKPVIKLKNPLFRAKFLKFIPSMGWIKKTLATLSFAGFTKIFTDALSIIKDKISLPGSDS
jgi:hypothetical protein